MANCIRFAGVTCPVIALYSNLLGDKIHEIILDISIATKAIEKAEGTLKGEIIQ